MSLDDLLFWAAMVFVVAVLALPVAGSMERWWKCRFHVPLGLHMVAGTLLLGAVLIGEKAWGLLGGTALALYLLYGVVGGHRMRDQHRHERDAGIGVAKHPAGAGFVAEVRALAALPRADLAQRAFEIVHKDLDGTDGLRYHLEIELLPESYQWGGGNLEMFERYHRSVLDGEPMKVIAFLRPAVEGFWRRRGHVSLWFRVDGAGRVTTGPGLEPEGVAHAA